MIKRVDSRAMRQRRHRRIRMKLAGTAERPRVCIFRSTIHIYAQIIDDSSGRTLCQASSLDEGVASIEPALPAPAPLEETKAKADKPDKGAKPGADKGAKPAAKPAAPATVGKKTRLAQQVGTLLAQRAKEKGIKTVVFDRGGYIYHGRVKALADSARAAGLEF